MGFGLVDIDGFHKRARVSQVKLVYLDWLGLVKYGDRQPSILFSSYVGSRLIWFCVVACSVCAAPKVADHSLPAPQCVAASGSWAATC